MRKHALIKMFVVAALAMLFALPMALAQSSSSQSGGVSGGTTTSGGASMSAVAAAGPSLSALENPEPGDWPYYTRDLMRNAFSPLTQINTDNVGQLQLAWSRDLGIITGIEGGPVEYAGVLYMASPDSVWALDATNGDLIWKYTATLDKRNTTSNQRGAPLLYNGKVYSNLGDGRVVALDAKTGKQDWIVQIGQIQYGEGFTNEPTFADGKIVVGVDGADCCNTNGRIVALDPNTGKTLWTFNVVPKPGQPGFDTWEPPSAAQVGGASAWSEGVWDPETNVIIWGTGQPDPWYAQDGVRRGKNLYSSSFVALDASTGKLLWYRQIVPNDEWDQDEPTVPIIVNTTIDGQMQRVAMIPGTAGYLQFVDIKTGKMIKLYNMYSEQTGLKQTVVGMSADGQTTINDSTRMTAVGQTSLTCPHRWSSYEPGSYDADNEIYYRPFSPVCVDIMMALAAPGFGPGQGGHGDRGSKFVMAPGLDYVSGMSAIDVQTGKTLWQFHYPYNEKAGAVATAGGVVFAAAPDRVFRAFEGKTGEILWKATLPALMSSDPITYEVNGTQYVAVVSGGKGNGEYVQTPDAPEWLTGSGTLFVFALPK